MKILSMFGADSRRTKAVSTILCLTICIAVCLTAGCNQNTIAALVSTLGSSTAAVASFEGHSDLAAKIRTDAEQAKADVLAWKPGTDSEMVVEAIHLLENDLNLVCASIPGQVGQDCNAYQPLIVLALATADSIISIVKPTAKAQARASFTVAPKSAKEYKVQWNSIVDRNPALAGVRIK
jgi:hypothetical protein